MNVVVFQCRRHGTVSHYTYDDACVATCFRGDDLALLFGRFTETGFSVGRESCTIRTKMVSRISRSGEEMPWIPSHKCRSAPNLSSPIPRDRGGNSL